MQQHEISVHKRAIDRYIGGISILGDLTITNYRIKNDRRESPYRLGRHRRTSCWVFAGAAVLS